MTEKRKATGWRIDVGATLTTMLLAGAPGGAAVVAPAAVEAQGSAAVSVTEANGVYSVTARFRVPEPPARVLEVLTDYENIPSFMPQIKSSAVLERESGRTVVEQEVESRLLTFSRQMHLILEITDEESGLRFRDLCGRSFHTYEGAWLLTERNGGTDVTYELTAQPDFAVPEFMLKRLLKRDSARMMAQLQNRMSGLRRADRQRASDAP